MDSSDLLALFRTEMNDDTAPFLWSDDDVISYIDDAQKQFCRDTFGIADDETPEVVQLAVTPGSDRIPLHSSIKQVRAATRGDTGREIDIVSPEEMRARGWHFDGRQGPVRALVIGGTANQVRAYPTSNETVTVQLEVYRLPLLPIDDTDEPLEIDDMHHRHLLMWVKHLAYSKQDAEAFDKSKAADFKSDFQVYCAKAKEEQRRARYVPRTVRYGGI